MKRYSILMLAIALTFGKANAQSDTYQIEVLSKPEKLLRSVSSKMLYHDIEKDFVKLSVADNLVDLGEHPVIAGYLKAYQNHYPITISPDIAWLLICQGFANHVNSDPEKIRSKFVNFEGKKTLTVVRDMPEGGNMASVPWETMFPEFTEQIGAFTGTELMNNLSADFTTTTPGIKLASQITIMESMKEFFNYKVVLIGCGLPEVTIKGSVKDWEKILTRLDYLSGYDLQWWTSELKPVIQKIIDTKKGNLDKQFWMNMVKYHKTGAYGTYDGIDGWLLKFYPYLQGGKPPVAENKPIASTGPSGIVPVDALSPNKTLYLRRSEFKEIKSVNVLPKEVVHVPFVLEIKDESGSLKESFKMEFWAGFMGVKQDASSYNVEPEIGWAVNRKKVEQPE